MSEDRKKVELFAEIFQAKTIINLYGGLPVKDLYTDYYGEIEGDMQECVVTTPGFINVKIDRHINLETVIAIDEVLNDATMMDEYIKNSILEVKSKITDEITKECPTRFAAQVVLSSIKNRKIYFTVYYGFAWEPKTRNEKIAEDAVNGAKNLLEELTESAKSFPDLNKNSAKIYSELAGKAIASIESLEDKDSFQLTRDIKRYQHQRLINRLERYVKGNEEGLEGLSKEKGVPASSIFSLIRDNEELKESLTYLKRLNLDGLY